MSELAPAPAQFPDAPATFALAGPAGRLEVATDVPKPEDARRGVAVIAHPHPLGGGTMTNKVVTMLDRALRELGLVTVRFNFRGVGASEGVHDDGHGETLDLLAVAEWAQAARPGDALWLAGFSFGSYVAARAARHVPVRQMISVAPPVAKWSFDKLPAFAAPWLVVQGEDDDVADAQATRDWIARTPHAPQLVVLPGTGHFFHGKLMDLRGAVKNGVRANLPPPVRA
jgi:hypothetical protein